MLKRSYESNIIIIWRDMQMKILHIAPVSYTHLKMLDSLIIGILCFIGCSIFSLPYTPLVSVVVGVTNMIPFFGPFLGAVPVSYTHLAAPRR